MFAYIAGSSFVFIEIMLMVGTRAQQGAPRWLAVLP